MKKSIVTALLFALVISLAGLAGCSASAKEPAQPTQAPAPTTQPGTTTGRIQLTPTPVPASVPTQAPQATSVDYRNAQYGFSFSLPASWQGYAVVADRWEGFSIDAPQGETPAEQGPQLLIRHPKWTSQTPRQDIPIMVFTLDQWNALQQGKVHVGAAPINPTELGRNARYVFALPARYNYAFPDGFEEVEQILQGHPLQTFAPAA